VLCYRGCQAIRRGRHYHIERDQIDAYRKQARQG